MGGVTIPEDVMEAARRAWPTAREEGVAIHMTIARAILAERQRCAGVARNATIRYEFDWRGMVEQPIVHRGRIADAILSGEK